MIDDSSTTTPVAPSIQPSLIDQIASVDALAVADRVISGGQRGAIQASTIEIVAMALLLSRLVHVADLTFTMLSTADRLQAASDPAARRALRITVTTQIAHVGAALEALGYGNNSSSLKQAKENANGEG